MTSKKKPQTLERELEKVRHIVSTLELNDLTLEKALTEYENGVALISQCQKTLKLAEQKIETLAGSSSDANPRENN